MWTFVFTGAVGGFVGVAELVTRYKDQPLALFRAASAWLYVSLNAAASISALHMARSFDWSFGATTPSAQAATQVLACGFGAMLILRSSILNIKFEGRTVPIGPSVILIPLLYAADRGVDRVRAKRRSMDTVRIMEGVSFEKAKVSLPAYCLSLMQNATPEEQRDLGEAVESIDSTAGMSGAEKTLTLGLLLMTLIGPDTLEIAVDALSNHIKPST